MKNWALFWMKRVCYTWTYNLIALSKSGFQCGYYSKHKNKPCTMTIFQLYQVQNIMVLSTRITQNTVFTVWSYIYTMSLIYDRTWGWLHILFFVRFIFCFPFWSLLVKLATNVEIWCMCENVIHSILVLLNSVRTFFRLECDWIHHNVHHNASLASYNGL